ncbi:protein SEC13 homolog [Halichondria panicea]|uniref:protein SEC13 homolog n=1 Tax=Halichondria panicea TaxID=6063 RepID=UPI00312BBD64
MSGSVSLQSTVDTGHDDMIHDAQLDYYGRKLATCSSDRTVRIFEIVNNTQNLVATLVGHEGPVWQVAWAHPKFGNIVASCSYDRKVIIWKETNGSWGKLYEFCEHKSSVNSIQWGPHEYGLVLACASSDESFSIISTSGDGNWKYQQHENAHTLGCNAISWAPALNPGSLVEGGSKGSSAVKRLVTGGGDNLVRVWREENEAWVSEKLEAHTDWVRDVAWCPSVGLPRSRVASCSQDCKVIIWTKDENSGDSWASAVLNTFNDVVWHASWSITGDILAISGGDNKVTLWKETPEGQWVCVSEVDKGQQVQQQTQ